MTYTNLYVFFFRNVQSFSTLGPKTSCVHWAEGEDTQAIVKVKGLNLRGQAAMSVVTKDSYHSQVQLLLSGVSSKLRGKCKNVNACCDYTCLF